MHKLEIQTKDQIQIKKLANELATRNHGEIFTESWDLIFDDYVNIDKVSYISLFCKNELKPYLAEIVEYCIENKKEPDTVDLAILSCINNNLLHQALLLYFETNSSHGEYCGQAMACAYMDGDLSIARTIHSKINQHGFDS